MQEFEVVGLSFITCTLCLHELQRMAMSVEFNLYYILLFMLIVMMGNGQ